MKKKFNIIPESTGKKYKLNKGELIVMSPDGIFFMLKGLGDWGLYINKLSDVIGNYDVIWKGEG